MISSLSESKNVNPPGEPPENEGLRDHDEQDEHELALAAVVIRIVIRVKHEIAHCADL